MAELAKLTTTLRIAGAAGFERNGVVVHLPRSQKFADNGRPVGQEAQAGPSGRERTAQPARERTARQQRRYERGRQARGAAAPREEWQGQPS